MRQSNLFLKLAMVLTVATAFSTIASAQSAELHFDEPQDDSIIWLNSENAGTQGERTISVNLFCTDGQESYSPKKIEIPQVDYVEGNSSEMSYSFSRDAKTGKYDVTAVCESSTNKTEKATKSFYVSEMDFEVLSPTYNDNIYRRYFMGDKSLGDLYKGQGMIVDVNVTGAPAGFGLRNQDFTFMPKLSNYENPSDGLDYNFEVKQNELSDDSYRIVLHPFVPADTPGGHHSITTPITYDANDGEFDLQVSTTDRATYLPGIRARSVNPNTNILYGQVGDINLELFVEPYYRKYQITEEDFRLKIDGEEYDGVFDLDRNEDTDGVYNLKLDTVPELPEEKDRFDVDILFKDSAKESAEQYIEIASYDVTSKVGFEGYVQNSKKQPIDTRFKVSTEDQYVQFGTTSSGFFSKKLEPGNKTFNVQFSKGGSLRGRLDLRNVQMEPKYESKVSFEYSKEPGSMGIKGIEPVNLMAMVFGHPFEEDGSTATMQFMSEEVGFGEVSVFECKNWKFDGRKCMTGWEKISEGDVERNPAQKRLEFPVDALKTEYFDTEKQILTNAYIIGTKASLELNGPLTLKGTRNGRIAVGDKLRVEGMVTSATQGVEDAEIEVAVMNEEEEVTSFSTETGSDGFFTARGEVPDDAGNYTLKVTANKGAFEGFETSGKEIWVYRSEGLDLDRPDEEDQPEIKMGSSSSLELELLNTGHTSITDITLEESGLPDSFVNVSESEIDLLEGGEAERLSVNFMIPSSYCDSGDCLFPTVEITAEGQGEKGEVESTTSIPLVLDSSSSSSGTSQNEDERTDTRQASEPENSTESPLSGITDPTAEFLASQSSLNLALGLIFVFLMALAGAVRKKNGSGSDGSRRNVMPNQAGGQASRAPQASRDQRQVAQPPRISSDKDQGQKNEEKENSEDNVKDAMKDLTEDGDSETEEEEVEEQENEDLDGSDEHRCDVCGDTFDTEAGVKMHKQVAH